MSDNDMNGVLDPDMQYRADETTAPLKISDLLAETGELSELIPAESLKGETFFIVRMNRFASQFEGQRYAYHCVCKETLDGDYFRTVLGGAAVVKYLDVVCELGIKNPIQVTLKYSTKGRYGGYYEIE